MRKLISFLFVSIFLLATPLAVHGADPLNAGFVEGLWYSDEPVIADEPARIYVALRNNTDHDITSTVRFNDNGVRIGTTYISALPGRLIEAWIDWTPRYGEHKITASLSDVRVHTIGENPESGSIEDTVAEDTIFVDYDTDKDDIGNEIDTDDDGDGISDTDEIAKGTNPLKSDTIEDKKETSAPTNTKTTNSGPDEETVTPKADESEAAPSRLGLEKYVPDGSGRSIITTVTEKIGETKIALDDYRGSRSDAIKTYLDGEKIIVVESGEAGTITRTQIESDEGFLSAVIGGGKALIRGFYSLVLWLVSNALAHPAILELLLLLLIIYTVYRTARRFGKRRQQ